MGPPGLSSGQLLYLPDFPQVGGGQDKDTVPGAVREAEPLGTLPGRLLVPSSKSSAKANLHPHMLPEVPPICAPHLFVMLGSKLSAWNSREGSTIFQLHPVLKTKPKPKPPPNLVNCLFYVCEFYVPVCMYTICTPGVCGGQKKGVASSRTAVTGGCEL